MGLLKLAISRQTKSLVTVSGSVDEIPPLFQTNTQDFQIQIVDQSNTGPLATYTAVDCSASSLRMVLSTDATGAPGDEAEKLLAATYAAGWSYDAVNDWFTGSLDLNTAEIQQFLGQLASKSAILEINLVTGGVSETVYGHVGGATNVTINANCDTGQSTAPSILTDPPTIGRVTIQDGVGGVTVADNIVTVTGLGLAFTPSYFLPFVEAPSGYGHIGADYIVGSGTSDGFSVVLSGIPTVATYKLAYIPVE